MRFLVVLFLLFSLQGWSSDTLKVYNPFADAEKDIAAALQAAKAQKKHILLQIGGNWCIWCQRLETFVKNDAFIQKVLEENFVVYHLNYSSENRNMSSLKKLGFPQRFGFPVLVIMDAEGIRLHTQDTTLLRQGNGYHRGQVLNFLQNWSAAALQEKND